MTLTTEQIQDIYEAAVHVEAVGDDQDAGFELLCKLDDVGGTGATIRKLIDMLRAANREAQPVAQPVAWTTVFGDKRAVTVHAETAEVWNSDGLQVQSLFTAPPAPAFPERLPCPVHLLPGLKFGKGVPTRSMLDALVRRAEYESEREAMTPEQKAEDDARIEAFKALLPRPPAPAVPDDYFGELVKKARSAADKAMRKFPQPNYVLNKVAEESGEVIKAVIHYTEGREEWANVEGEIIDNLAMLIRLVVEGDQVIGFTPPDTCRAAMLAQPVSSGYTFNSPVIPDGWIACSERMPELDKRVLLYFGSYDGHIEDGCIGDDGDGPYHYFFDGDSLQQEPTHWMPLPAAPEGGNGA